MSTYRTTAAKRDGSDAATQDASGELMPCRYCQGMAKRVTLMAYGARCGSCFGQYLRLGYSGQEPPRQIPQAAWVRELAAKCKGKSASRNAFSALAEKLEGGYEHG